MHKVRAVLLREPGATVARIIQVAQITIEEYSQEIRKLISQGDLRVEYVGKRRTKKHYLQIVTEK